MKCTSLTCKKTCCRRRNAREFTLGYHGERHTSRFVLRWRNTGSELRSSYQDIADVDVPEHQLTESVERLVVDPVIRTAPWDMERLRQQEQKPQVCILVISESDVCRSVLAAASLRELLAEEGLEGRVQLSTCGTRPYNVGEGPDPAAAAVAEALGFQLPEDHTARLFDPAYDIVSYDLLLVMDKFTASDVMREVSSFELINRMTQFSYKVRRLGEFLAVPGMSGSSAFSQYGGEGDELDIEDPLYGNVGGEEGEQMALRTARVIWGACRGLVTFLRDLERQESERAGGPAIAEPGTGPGTEEGAAATTAPPPMPLGPVVRAKLRTMGTTAWLSPPMLSPRVDLENLQF